MMWNLGASSCWYQRLSPSRQTVCRWRFWWLPRAPLCGGVRPHAQWVEDAGQHDIFPQQRGCCHAGWNHLRRGWIRWQRVPQHSGGVQPWDRRVERLHQGPVSPLWLRGGSQGVGEFHSASPFSQTNRLSDVIVFRDVLCVYERMWVGVGIVGMRGLQWRLAYNWRLGMEGLLPKATWRLCILHTMFSVLYIFLFLPHFLSYANI